MDPHASIDDSPLAVAYLQDLRDSLQGAEVADRESIISSVREHIATRFAEQVSAGGGDMTAVLRELGPVEKIVGNADASPAPSPYAGFRSTARQWWTRPGAGILVAAIACLVLSTFVVGGIGAVGVLIALWRSHRAHPGEVARGFVMGSTALAIASIGITTFAVIPMLA